MIGRSEGLRAGRPAARPAACIAARRRCTAADDGGYDEPAPAAAPAAPAAPDYAEELQKLAELKAAGVINDEEFEAKKKQILGI